MLTKKYYKEFSPLNYEKLRLNSNEKFKKLKKAKEYFLDADKFNDREALDWFMKFTIDMFTSQLKQINKLEEKIEKLINLRS